MTTPVVADGHRSTQRVSWFCSHVSRVPMARGFPTIQQRLCYGSAGDRRRGQRRRSSQRRVVSGLFCRDGWCCRGFSSWKRAKPERVPQEAGSGAPVAAMSRSAVVAVQPTTQPGAAVGMTVVLSRGLEFSCPLRWRVQPLEVSAYP